MNNILVSNPFDRDDSDRENALNKLLKLKRKKEDLLSLISSIDYVLSEEGYQIDSNNSLYRTFDEIKDNKVKTTKPKLPQSGIRINHQLSFRGKEKATEYFKIIDEDNDGLLSFEDFRAMKSLVKRDGIVHEPEYLEFQSWKLYMDDLGIKTHENGKVDLDGFIYFRCVNEQRNSLAYELNLLNIGLLPSKQIFWANMKNMIQEALLDSAYHPPSPGQHQLKDMLDFEDVSFVLANLQIPMQRIEFVKSMLIRASFEKVMDHILRRSLRVHYNSSPQRFSNMLERGVIPTTDLKVTPADILTVPSAQFMAWLLSALSISASHPSCLRSSCGPAMGLLLQFKYLIYRNARKVYQLCKTCYDVSLHIKARQLFKDIAAPSTIKAANLPQNKLFLQYSVICGPISNGVEEGLAATCLLTKLTNPEDHYVKLKLSKDCGLTLVIDLSTYPDAPLKDTKKTAECLTLYLRYQFDDELKKNPNFRGLFVYPALSDCDGTAVLRVAVTYKKNVTVDGFLEHMNVPFKLHELLTDLSCSLKFSSSLTELLSTVSMPLDTFLTGKFDMRLCLNGAKMKLLFERLLMGLRPMYREDQVAEPPAADAIGHISFHQEYARLNYIQRLLPLLLCYVEWLYSLLLGLASFAITSKYGSFSELLILLGCSNIWFKRHWPPDWSSENGRVNRLYELWKKRSQQELDKLFSGVQKHLQNKLDEAGRDKNQSRPVARTPAAIERELRLKERAEANQKIVEKMTTLGIQVDDALAEELLKEETSDATSLIEDIEDQLMKRDIQALIAYEKLRRVCFGIHSIEVICGQSLLTVNFYGFDVFEHLPTPPPMQELKNNYDTNMQKNK